MNRVLDSFLRGFGRSIGWKLGALALLLVLGWFGMGEARAGDVAPCAYNATLGKSPCDQGMAYSNAYKHADQYWDTKYCTSVGTWQKISITVVAHSSVRYKAQVVCKRVSDGFQTMFSPSFEFLWSGSCAERADLVGLSVQNFQGGSNICNFGCEYGQTTPKVDTTITDASNPQNSLRFGVLLGGKASGATCLRDDGRDKPPEPGEEPPQCLTVGQDSNGPIQHCPKPDGGTCIVTGKGTKFCQPPPPGTDGPKVDTGREAGMSQSADGNSPPQPPANRPGENFQPSSSSTVTNNITNNTSNTNSYTNTGSPNPNASPLPGDGSGPSGTGQQEGGAGTGTGTGSATDMGPTNSLLGGIGDTLNGIKGWWDGLGGEAGTLDTSKGDDVSAGDAWTDEVETPSVDAGGYGWGNTCPTPPQINVPGGGQLDWSLLCTMAGYLGALILAAGYVQAAYVIGRA